MHSDHDHLGDTMSCWTKLQFPNNNVFNCAIYRQSHNPFKLGYAAQHCRDYAAVGAGGQHDLWIDSISLFKITFVYNDRIESDTLLVLVVISQAPNFPQYASVVVAFRSVRCHNYDLKLSINSFII